MRLAGKVVLVTGAASGMGRVAIGMFADQGAKVIAADVNADGLAAALEPGGTLVVSGIIEDRYEEVALALAAAGLVLVDLLRETDWVAIVAEKR